MTNERILAIAMEQSAIDLACAADDFLKNENLTVISKADPRARKYLQLPFECNLVSYGGNVVASTSAETAETVSEYISTYPPYCCFETPNMNVLSEKIAPYGLSICFMAEYFLPDVRRMQILPCNYKVRILEKDEFEPLYLPQWQNALCKKRKEYDMLAIGAYDGTKLIGLAGCSADCETMWQIGIDVLPEYRRQGIAMALTSRIAAETFERGKVPFYCAAWSNIKSVRNAIACGFVPSWTELTAKKKSEVDKLNGK